MYLLLLVFGAVLGVAGVVLTIAGVSLRDGSVDAGILTPGIVATVGGVLLIGLGAGLRTLQRIEQVLATRPMPRPLPIPDSKPIELDDASRKTAEISLTAKAARSSQGNVAVHEKRAEEAEAVGERIPPSLPAIMLANPADAEVEAAPAGKGANGTSAGRAAGPANIRPVAPRALERRKGPAFDLLWPKGQRPQRAVEVKSSQTDVVPAAEAAKTAEQGNGPTPEADAATAGASVLKSGVVNGMPYTLYSDGSIEAQLPEGVLRFGSITELRDHIEESA
jgi:hypothetical protein